MNFPLHPPTPPSFTPEEAERLARMRTRLQQSAVNQHNTAFLADFEARITLLPLDKIPQRPFRWLWKDRLPGGKLSLLSGTPGTGKTFLVCDLIARVTRGTDWPDGIKNERPPGRVLLISPAAATQKMIPRLEAAGADLALVQHFNQYAAIDPNTGQFGPKSWSLADSEMIFSKVIEEAKGFDLIVVDRLDDFIGDGISSQQQSQQLAKLELLIDGYGSTMICVTTADKARKSGVVWERESAFSTVWGITRDPFDRQHRLLLPIRTEFSSDHEGLSFVLDSTESGQAKVVWSDDAETACYEELTARPFWSQRERRPSQTSLAEMWLRGYLREGEKPSVEIFEAARSAGFTERPLRTALTRIADNYKQSPSGRWIWKLQNGQ